MLTLGQAARAIGVSKSTISRHIKSGKLSANTTDNGGYQIDPSELQRGFPNHKWNLGEQSQSAPVERSATPQPVTDATLEAAELRGKLSGAEQVIEQLKAQLADAQTERDEWREQAKEASQSAQRLIEHQQQERHSAGLLSRVFGRIQRAGRREPENT